MRVRSGWSNEYARKKYDVELDEADLVRILAGAGIPARHAEELPLGEAHNLLYLSAEILARHTLVRFDSSQRDALKPEAEQLGQQRKEALARIRQRYGLEKPGE